MAQFWDTNPQNGTADNDLLFGHPFSGPAHTQNGGAGNDLAYGDFDYYTAKWGGTSATAFDLTSSPNIWSTAGQPDILNPSVPHASALYTDTAAQAAVWYRINATAGATITIDVDHGADDVGGGAVDTFARLYDTDATTVLATALNTPAGLEAATLVSTDDPFITYTLTSAGTYFIRISPEDGTNFAVGDTFEMNVSLTGQPVTGGPEPGNDVMHGNEGDDVLYGLYNTDEMFGDDGDDRLFGGSGDDLLAGGGGDDKLNGGAQDDILQGGDGSDVLRGGAGANQVLGGLDTDLLVVGFDAPGSTFDGGPGDDALMIERNLPLYDMTAHTVSSIELIAFDDFEAIGLGSATRTGATTIRVTAGQIGGGLPLVAVYGAAGAVFGMPSAAFPETLEIIMGDTQFLSLGETNFQLFDDDDKVVVHGDATAEEIRGGEIIDEIFGGAGDDELLGEEGDDLLDGGDGDDYLSGSDGDDVLDAGAGADELRGGDDDNSLDGGSGADFMRGGDGDDLYFVDDVGDEIDEDATLGSDTVRSSIGFDLASSQVTGEVEHLALTGSAAVDGTGNALDNTITGNGAANVLRGLDGADTLAGGSGDDVLIGGGGIDVLNGGVGSDTASYEDSSTGVRASLSDPAGNGGSAAGETYTSIENLTGSAKGDRLTGSAVANVLGGRAGNDKLFGLDGADLLEGRDGNDLLVGGGGGDRLRGSHGKDTASYQDAALGVVASLANPSANTGDAAGDTYSGVENLTGSTGDDTLAGQKGANVLKGLGGGDKLNGGKGNDKLVGGGGSDKLAGGSGDDKLGGGAGADKLVGSKGDDRLSGAAGADKLNGGKGRDKLDGGGGSDKLAGGAGADKLDGGGGKDMLAGGGGGDVFLFRSVKDSTVGGKGRDVISDFKRNQGDEISLKAIDAKTGKKNQAFKFIGDDAFSDKKGELRYDKKADKTFIYGDVNGDGKADFAIQITKAIDLVKGDFAL